jgi:hypothetical protein
MIGLNMNRLVNDKNFKNAIVCEYIKLTLSDLKNYKKFVIFISILTRD